MSEFKKELERLKYQRVDKYGKIGYSHVQDEQPFGGQCTSFVRWMINKFSKDLRADTFGHAFSYAKLGKKVLIPKNGDIVVWKKGAGGFGHVGIWFNGAVWQQNPYTLQPLALSTFKSWGLSSREYRRIEWKAGIFDEPKPKKKLKWTIGKYKLLVAVNIRSGYGIMNPIKMIKEITKNGQKYATKKKPNDLATYKKGTCVGVSAVKKDSLGNIWGKTPSGWIALYYNGKKFAKKVK